MAGTVKTPEVTSDAPVASERLTLKRALGPRIAMAVVVGNVIGSGIFLKPGTIAAEGGSFGLILAVWIMGGVLCLLGALCFAELATMLPQAGGLYVYLREAYGRPVAFLFGWSEFLFGKPASIGALAIAFVGSLSLAMGWESAATAGHSLGQVALAVFLIAGMAWINILGVLWGGRVQMVTTVLKAAGVALIATAPFVLIPFTASAVDASNYATTVVPEDGSLASRIGLVLLAVMWAYNGWHGITPLAEEVRQPSRNIPLALFGGIGLLILLYLGATFAYHGVLSMSEMAAAGENAAERMLGTLLGPRGIAIMSAIIMCSTFGAINTNLLQAPRVTFAMGRDDVFFRGLGRVHASYRTPAPAIFVTAAMAIALVITVAIAQYLVRGMDASVYRWELLQRVLRSLQDDSIFKLLTNFVIFSASIFYVLGVLAVFVLRRRLPDVERPYRTWGFPLVPVVFVAVYCWFLVQIYHSSPLESRTGVFFIALGLPVYYAYRRWGRHDEQS